MAFSVYKTVDGSWSWTFASDANYPHPIQGERYPSATDAAAALFDFRGAIDAHVFDIDGRLVE